MKKYSERNKRLKKRKKTKESWLSDLDQEYIGFITCFSHLYTLLTIFIQWSKVKKRPPIVFKILLKKYEKYQL